jgi:hypothetical protein
VSAGTGLPITTGKTVPVSTSRTNSPAVAPDTNFKETSERPGAASTNPHKDTETDARNRKKQ